MISLRDMLDTNAPEARTAAHALMALYAQIPDEKADAQLYAFVKWLHVRHPLDNPQYLENLGL